MRLLIDAFKVSFEEWEEAAHARETAAGEEPDLVVTQWSSPSVFIDVKGNPSLQISGNRSLSKGMSTSLRNHISLPNHITLSIFASASPAHQSINPRFLHPPPL